MSRRSRLTRNNRLTQGLYLPLSDGAIPARPASTPHYEFLVGGLEQSAGDPSEIGEDIVNWDQSGGMGAADQTASAGTVDGIISECGIYKAKLDASDIDALNQNILADLA